MPQELTGNERMNFNDTMKEIIKVLIASIFTLFVISSLTSISNSIFINKAPDVLSNKKIDQIRSKLVSTKKSLDYNEKKIPHTVLGRERLIQKMEEQKKVINSLAHVASIDGARQHLVKLGYTLRNTEIALSHSVLGRDKLIKKIDEQKEDIISFKKIMLSSDLNDNLDLSVGMPLEEIVVDSLEEKKVIDQAPKLTFEEELKLASVDAGAKLSKKCTACHSLNSGGTNRVGPGLWNIVNAPKAKVTGFSYSDSLIALGGNWTVQDLNLWLKSPKKFAPGNAMSFAGLRKTKDRANMVAFLNSISDKPLLNNGLN